MSLLSKKWDKVKSDVDGQAGLKLKAPDFKALIEAMIKGKSHAIMFNLVLTKSEFRLDVEAGDTTVNAGKVAVPSDLEEYRNFLANLNGWSQGDHNLVPDSDFKAFNTKNPVPPPKPSYKTYDELVKKNIKSEVEAFRTWAKTNSVGKKAIEAIDKTAKAKPTDAPRVQALKDANAAWLLYLKTF
ncbi:MAG: hypothetical protein M3Y55_10540 [Pseudomonadota bacterium]|nr:hypothetical protein [Pseudomonadota bacterium]